MTRSIRPEQLTLGDGSGLSLNGAIDLVERLGENGYPDVGIGGAFVIAEIRGLTGLSTGDAVSSWQALITFISLIPLALPFEEYRAADSL